MSLKAVGLTNAGSGTHISELADNGMAALVDGSSIVLFLTQLLFHVEEESHSTMSSLSIKIK